MADGNVVGRKGTATAQELIEQADRPPRPLRFEPRTRLTPVGHAIQHAMFRVDRDGRTRLEKIGEMLVKKSVAGDLEATKIAFERFVGKVMPQDDKGADRPDLGNVVLAGLVEALIEKKLGGGATVVGSASLADVVEQVTRKKE